MSGLEEEAEGEKTERATGRVEVVREEEGSSGSLKLIRAELRRLDGVFLVDRLREDVPGLTSVESKKGQSWINHKPFSHIV